MSSLGLDDLLLASPRRDSTTPLDEISIPLSGPLAKEAISQALTSAFKQQTSNDFESRDELGGGGGGVVSSGQWILKCRMVNTAMDSPPGSRRRSSSGRGALAASALSMTWRDEKPSEERDDNNNETIEDVAQLKLKLNNFKQENDILKYRLAEVEANLKKALQNVKTFHQSQQQLFNDFVLLREKYDEAKSHISEVLWSYLPAQSKYCPSIPALLPTLNESEKRVGDYDIGEKLGEGQFAKVFKCTRRPTTEGDAVIEQFPPEEFALKVINKEKVSSMAALKRVDSEIGAQMTLRHRGILQVHDVINGKHGLYVIMDKGGKDLFDYFDEKPDRVSLGDLKILARSIIDAINFCHTQGICHRDLKPENILLNTNAQVPRGEGGAFSPTPFLENSLAGANSYVSSIFQVKLCDFGLCSPFVKGKKLNDFCGSPGFFAPEMITCPAYDGPAVDLWSIGCILLELSVGHEIFCDQWMVAYDYDLLQDPPKFDRKLRECVENLSDAMRGPLNLDENLVNFILGLLNIDPTKRLTIEQIVSHPWIAMEDGRSFLTGDIQPPAAMMLRSPLSLSNSKGGRLRPSAIDVNGQSKHPHHVVFSIGSSLEDGVEGNSSKSPLAQSEGGHSMNGALIRNSMSNKARSKMEQQQTSKVGSTGVESKRGLQLPPLEPQTPAVGAAKKILWVGDEILQKAEEASSNVSTASMDDSRHPAMLVLSKERGLPTREKDEQPIGRPAW